MRCHNLATFALSLLLACNAVSAHGQEQQDVTRLVTGLEAVDPAVRVRSACELIDAAENSVDLEAAVPVLSGMLSDRAEVSAEVCDEIERGWGWWRDGIRQPAQVGRAATRALLAIGNASSNIDIAPIFMRALADESGVARANAAWGLGAIDHAPAVEGLVEIVRNDEYVAARREAAWALGAIDASAGLPGIEAGLQDASPLVREQAAWAAGAMDASGLVEALMRTLVDNNAEVREQSAWALGAIGDEHASKALQAALKDASPRVREQAAWALGAIGGRDAVPALIEALGDKNADVREQSAWALGAIGDKRAEAPLLDALSDPVRDVREQVAWALSNVI